MLVHYLNLECCVRNPPSFAPQVKFIDSLTNVYVRYNRRRLKGAKGPEDTATCLSCLFNVLLDVCKVRPFQTRAWVMMTRV